jgi:hypothetical protein
MNKFEIEWMIAQVRDQIETHKQTAIYLVEYPTSVATAEAMRKAAENKLRNLQAQLVKAA